MELFQATEVAPVPLPERAGPHYPGWRHICFQVNDIDQKLTEMGEAAKLTFGPIELDNLATGMRACWLADPEGNIVELSEGYHD